jgi:hypothetical protein
VKQLRRSLVTFGAAAALFMSLAAQANVPLTQISQDPFSDVASQHATEVEPGASAFGSTIVASFQEGRFVSDGGAAGIGFATSTDAGASWTHGSLLLTKLSGGNFDRASDPAAAYDARHGVWLISALVIDKGLGGSLLVPPGEPAIVTSRSTDGGLTWSEPVGVVDGPSQGSLDKPWLTCDNTPTSPFYGHCYEQWTYFGGCGHVELSTSTDGGLTWGPVRTPANSGSETGGQPVVQPSGTVIVPITGGCQQNSLRVFRSLDGGATWSPITRVDDIRWHTVAGGFRPRYVWPSAAVDASGKVYVAWWDCRFRKNCSSNDIILSTSTDGVNWSPAARVPIDPVTSTVDHFISGLGVDPATSGAAAHIGLTYYYYPDANCDSTTCQLDVGFVSSANGGSTWSAPTQLAGPMSLSWLANTVTGRMVGEYISTPFTADGLAHPVLSAANAPSGGLFDQATYTTRRGLATAGGTGIASSNGVVFTGTTANEYAPEP